MKIKSVKIQNFRGYKNETEIFLNNLTVFIGKNDIGKSTILEALDIFFNDGKGTVKIDKGDLNKNAEIDGESEFSITVTFENFIDEIDLDAGNKTSLKDEYLLNKDGLLEIKKIYLSGKCKSVLLICNHPTNPFAKDLLSKKQKDLQKIISDEGYLCIDKSLNSELRKSIRDNCGDLNIKEIELDISKEDGKMIWGKLEIQLPLYTLFQSDRTNTDQNNEVQDPLKIVVNEVMKDPIIQEQLKKIAEKVKEETEKVAGNTLKMLEEMNPEISKDLKPNIPSSEDLSWADVFKKISIDSDNGIPLNKRGSGVKRLVLLNFFRAEAERRKSEKKVTNVIYAIEEPETSQHPEHQKILINSFIKLSESGSSQILLTTHSPSIAQMIPSYNIRFVNKDEEGNLGIYFGDVIMPKIVDTLGALPLLSKIVICVEGEHDRNFLLNIGKIPELKEIIDISLFSILPLKGSNLKIWVERDYLRNSNIIEFHLYDKDSDLKYKDTADKINSRADNSKAILTEKREMENYIHPSLIESFPKFTGISLSSIIDWDTQDIPNIIKSSCTEFNYEKGENAIKDILNGSLSNKMTIELFEKLGALNEVRGWFEKIKELNELTI